MARRRFELSADQKEKIFAIEDKYDSKIRALVKRIERLDQQKNAEIDAILTSQQRKLFKAFNATAQSEP